MTGLNPWDNTLTIPGQHVPECDSQLGPDFEVEPGVVRMTLHICFGCKPVIE